MVGSKILNMAGGLDKLIPTKEHPQQDIGGGGANEESEERGVTRNVTAAPNTQTDTIINTGGPASIKSGLS